MQTEASDADDPSERLPTHIPVEWRKELLSDDASAPLFSSGTG